LCQRIRLRHRYALTQTRNRAHDRDGFALAGLYVHTVPELFDSPPEPQNRYLQTMRLGMP